MYSISEFGQMIADEKRTDAYVAALERLVTPEAVVLDIGTGTGVFAMLACKFGARRVYAVEPGEAIHVARHIARENGYHERVTFIQDLSTRITLPERADIVISDLHGVLPFFQFHIPSIMDARQRHLAVGGSLIPRQDRVWATVVTAPEQYRQYVTPWIENKYELKMQAGSHIVTNVWTRGAVKPEQFLAQPRLWATLDYTSIASPDLCAGLSWTVEQEAVAHGICAWFDTEVAEGISLSNAPGLAELVYGHAFFPWTRPVALRPGDLITATLDARLVGDDYVWRWETKIVDPRAEGSIKASFKQSTFHSTLLSPSQLSRQTAGYVARLNREGEIDRFVLDRMDGERLLAEIAEALIDHFPGIFANRDDALGRVGQLSQKYSQ